MAFRELSVVLIREILRRWAAGESLRNLAAATGADRKTVRRYVAAVQRAGLKAGNGVVIDDAILDKVVAEVLPGAPPEIGPARSLCRQHHALRVKVSRTPTPLQITEQGSPDQTHVDLDHPRHHHGHRAGPH